jgi:hypothetical protein
MTACLLIPWGRSIALVEVAPNKAQQEVKEI